jgi:uncharacterized membrane protein YdbT with pleckstrin-like domain
MKFFSFLIKSKNTFEGERPGENTILLIYRHWFVLFIRLLPFFILFFLPPAIYFFTKNYIAALNLTSLFNFTIAIYYIFWWNGLFYQLTMYLLDIWIVTNYRILDNRQHGFFNRTLTEASLMKIQDQSVEIRGLIPTILNYGNLTIQTAGSIPKIEMREVPKPNAIKNKINEVIQNFQENQKHEIQSRQFSDL